MIGVDRRGSERRFNFVRGAAGRCHFPSPSSQFDHGGVQYEGMHKPVFVFIRRHRMVGRFGGAVVRFSFGFASAPRPGVGLTWARSTGYRFGRAGFPRLVSKASRPLTSLLTLGHVSVRTDGLTWAQRSTVVSFRPAGLAHHVSILCVPLGHFSVRRFRRFGECTV
jgi:hypothetical protein